MQFIENLRLAVSALVANKMRALLTMLGIIIGISAVIMITTIGTSIQKTLTNTFNSIGNFNYFMAQFMVTDDDVELTREDFMSREMLDELVETYPGHFTPDLSESFGLATVRNPKGQYITINVSGSLEESTTNDHKRGRSILAEDSKQLKNAVYVSDLFVRQYFGSEDVDPIGKTFELTFEDGVSSDFTIVGYYELSAAYQKNYPPGTKDIDKTTTCVIPLDTGLELEHKEQRTMSYVQIRYNTDVDMELQKQELQDFFDEKYAEKPGMEIEITNMQDMLGMINTVISIVTIAISGIAAISLVVGGVGVMNIMLVSITERTKEIGVRKALGAQNSAIRLQFVIEAIMICLIGGIIGIIMGILGGLAIGWIAKTLVTQFYSEYADLIFITIEPSFLWITVAVVFSIITGVIFGYYPANKAAKMNPIDALRYD